MSNALRKDTRVHITPRKAGEVVCAHPVSGVHADQVQAAFEKVFRRYEATLKELSKV